MFCIYYCVREMNFKMNLKRDHNVLFYKKDNYQFSFLKKYFFKTDNKLTFSKLHFISGRGWLVAESFCAYY